MNKIMKKTRNSLIIIPAYNEESKIGGVIDNIKNYIVDAEILVVSDGSDDNTEKVAREKGANVISLPFNLGYGSALETGYKYAFDNDYKYIVQMDGDGQHEAKCVNNLLNVLLNNEADIVIGSRFLDVKNYRTSFSRHLGMIIFAKITSWLTKQKITDSTSGFQAMNHRVLLFFAHGFYPSDYPDADVVILLKNAGFRIAEIPVIMYSNNNSKSMHSGIIRPMYYIFKMFLSIGMIFLRKDKNK